LTRRVSCLCIVVGAGGVHKARRMYPYWGRASAPHLFRLR